MKHKYKGIFKRALEKALLFFLIGSSLTACAGLLEQMVFYSKIKPVLDQIEIGALILFTTTYNALFLRLVISVGLILIYLAIKNKGGKTNGSKR
jgi:membrane glycosyltransferase